MDVVVDVNPLLWLVNPAAYYTSHAGSQAFKPIFGVWTIEIVGRLCEIAFHDVITITIVNASLRHQ